MMGYLRFVAASFAICLAFSGAAYSGPVLDDLLNYAAIDQKCPSVTIKEEGMGLTGKGVANFTSLSKERPLGQSFVVGPTADKLCRIHVGLCHWPDSWQQGEEVTFTLWDSTKKENKLYSRTLDFTHKWYKWDVVFDIYMQTKPGAEYYFELTHNGGADNKINVAYIPGNDYKQGQAYYAGQSQDNEDLYFVAVTKTKGDRIANLKKLINRFDLNYPPLVEAKWAYYRGDYDKACELILRYFENRTQPDPIVPKPVPAGKFDTKRVDAVCDQGRFYNDEEGKKDEWMEMGPQTTWREVWPNTAEYIRHNDLFSDLGRAYQSTRNEKYAVKLNELMLDLVQDNPSPFEGGMRGGRWVAMFAAWRLGDAWTGFGAACKSKGLTDDAKLAWLDYWNRMAKFAELEHSGGNHANAVGQSLMQFGYRFPEFREAKHWRQWGFNKLVENSLDLFYEDGACREPTMNYHGYSLANLMSGLEMADKYGVEIPQEIMKLTEKALAYTAYMLRPNGVVPSNGDTNCEDFRANVKMWDGWRKGEAMKGYEMFGRKDLLYIATAGKEGTMPESHSYCFPDIGHYIMRSDWGQENGGNFEDARYLLFRSGSYGGHGHWDLNQITLYAYGRPLIIDPGRTRYDSPLMPILIKNKSHNVLLVDDLDMNRVDPKLSSWHTTPSLDFIDNTYKNLYNGVDHRRAVVFVRPDYYVMFDRVTGSDSHRMGINFWLTPPEVTINKDTCSVNSNEPEGANVLLKVVDPSGVDITERKGTVDLGEERSDIPVITFWQNGKSQASFTTVMYPYPKGTKSPDIKTNRSVTGEAEICSIETPAGVDYVFYAPEPARAVMADTTAFEGRSGLIRVNASKEIISLGLINGKSVVLGGQTLVECRNPVEELSVVYSKDKVEVTCPKSEPLLQIASLGRTKAVVNGKEIAVNGEMFKPFQ